MVPFASAHIATGGFGLPNSGVLVFASAQNPDTGLLVPVPWIQDREPADNPATSRILVDNHTTAYLPIIGLQSSQTPTRIQVRNLLVEDHVLNGQIVVATLLLEPLNITSLSAPVSVSLALPPGVDYVTGSMSQPAGAAARIRYDLTTRRLTVANIPLNIGTPIAYTYRLAVNVPTTPINHEIRMQATSSARYTYDVVPSVLRIGQPTPPQTVTPGGGTYSLGNGRMTLTFPPGAVSLSTIITGVEYADLPVPAGQTGPSVLFEVFPAMTFGRPVTVQVDLNGLVITDSLAAGQWPNLDHLYTESISITPGVAGRAGVTSQVATGTTQLRDEVPTTFDDASGLLTAQLTHFSTYEAGVQYTAPQAWKFETNLGSVSSFRGAATVGYSFQMPPMQDGLQPVLSVQYSSAAAEQGTISSDGPPSDGPGLGWSFDTPQVTRRVKMDTEDDASYVDYEFDGIWYREWHHKPRYVGRYANDFSLSLGGAQYWLIPGNTPGEYVTEQYAMLRIRRCNDDTPCTGEDAVASVANETGEFWQVWTPDGARYVFGTTQDSEQLFPVAASGARGTPTYAGRIPNQVASAWQLAAVYARHRDDPATGRASATYRYHDVNGELNIERAALAEVWYGSSLTSQGDVATGLKSYHVIVDYTMRGNKQMQPIYVRVLATSVIATGNGGGAGSTDELLRRYALDYDAQHNLAGVREEVWNGAAYVALPGMTFGYTQMNGRSLLSTVSNGYGGSQQFGYVRVEPASYVVSRKVLRNGLGWESLTDYTYVEPCFSKAGNPCHTSRHEWSPSGAVLGFRTVNQVLRDPGGSTVGSAVLARSRQSFHMDVQKLGRADEQVALDSSGTTILTRQTTEYQLLQGAGWGLPDGSWFVGNSAVTAYPAGSNGVMSDLYKRIETSYTPPAAGERFVAQPTEIKEYSGATLTKRSVTQYQVQVSPRLMLQPVQEQIFDAADRPLSDMRYGWDGGTGDLTFVQQAVVLQPCPSEITPRRTSCEVTRDIAVGYDVFGNKTSETVFDDYGTPGMVRTANRAGATSRFEYDATYRLYPVTWINPLSQTTQVEYFGLNGIDLPVANGARLRASLGQVKREIGPNGEPTAVRYAYDVFGRLLSVTQPEPVGTTSATALPTMEYAYSDGTALSGTYAVSDTTGNTYPSAQILQTSLPLQGIVITTRQRPNSQQAPTYDTAQMVDGLGRMVQTKSATDTPGQWNAVYMAYDAAGRAVRQSAPVPSSGPLASLDFAGNPGWSQLPHTLTTFDALGRPVAVTGPDGTTVRSAYTAYNVAALDANGHLRVNLNDALGRLMQVQEYSGTFASLVFTATPYAITQYGYDPADRLIQVNDALGHRTVISYNAFGEKTAMQDPDMGVWNYTYNARGQLVSQTDAKGQTLWFGYDVTGRLTSKGEADGVLVRPLASYGYDEGAFGLGQRTTVRDTTGTWQASYDVRGQVIAETRAITLPLDVPTALGQYTLRRGYDNLNRPTWVQYPDGEVVTTTYGAQGPIRLAGQTALVSGASYNSLGQPTQITLGNGLTTRYGYYGYAAFGNLLGNGSGLPVSDAGSANFGRLAAVCTAGDVNACATLASTPTQVPQSLRYQYDPGGNVTRITDNANAGQIQQFEYDPLSRLISAGTNATDKGYADTASGHYRQEWRYDAIGNMTTRRTLTDTGWLTDQYGYAADKPHAVTTITRNDARDGAASFAAGYDQNGNMITRTEGSVIFVQTWDSENRLISVTTSAPNAALTQEQYFYSADGERIVKRTAAGTTIYIGELYEETVLRAPPIQLTLAQTPASLNGALVPGSLPAQAGNLARPQLRTLAAAAANPPLPALEPAELQYAADFGQGGPVPGWEMQGNVVYDCEVQKLKVVARNPATDWFTQTWASQGWRIEAQNTDHVAGLFNTIDLFPEAGPLIVTGEALWSDQTYDTGYGTALRLAAFRPSDFVTPSLISTSTLMASGFITVPRGQASGRWLYWDALTPPSAACQHWRERYGINPNSQSYVTDTAGYPGPVMPAGVTPAWGVPYYFKAVYVPETQINLPEERGRIELYASLVDNPSSYTLMRVETDKLRPHSVMAGYMGLLPGPNNWVNFSLKRLAVYAPLPSLDALPVWSEGSLRGLSWGYSGVNTAQVFEVQRATDVGFSTDVMTQAVTAPFTTTTFAGLSDGATYYYRVRALNGPLDGSVLEPSGWSNVVSSTQDVNAPMISNLVPRTSPQYLSPNGDGVLDMLAFSFDAADAAIGIASWQAGVWTAGGGLVKTFAAQPGAPFSFVWDGHGDDGAVVADGPYEARVVVSDTLGHAAYATFGTQIRVDRTPPAEQVTSLYQPNKGLAINWAAGEVPAVGQGYAAVHGKTNLMDVNGVTQVTFNGSPVVVAGQDFTATLTPALGPNDLTFGFTDPAGNTLTVQRTLIYTTTGPSLIAFGPTGTVAANTPGVRPILTGTFNPAIPVDPFSVRVTVDGVPATGTITAAGFTVQPIANVAGGNGRPVRVVADFASLDGRTGQAEWAFAVDTLAEISVSRPVSGSALNQVTQAVAGQTDPNAQVILRIGGAELARGVADASGYFAFASVILPVGTFTLEAEATDPYGHITTQAVALTLDPTAASAELEVQPAAFSPNGDGVREVASLAASVQPPASGVIAGWRIEIASALGGAAVQSWQGQIVVTPTLTWDGTGVPDGPYWVTLWVTTTSSNALTRTVQVRQPITLDRSVPAAPVILAPTGILTTALPPATGTATPGSWVLVYRDGLTVTTEVARADAAGNWTLTRMPLRAGENTLTARSQNAAGTWSGWSAPVVVTVPVQPPLISVGIAPDLAGLGTTLSLTATARGDGDPAQAVAVVARPRERSVVATLNMIVPSGLVGSWQVDKPAGTDWCAPLGFCLDELIFAGTDTLGNTGLATTTLTLDYLPPDAPQIDSPRGRSWIQTDGAWVRGHVWEPLLTVVLTGGASPITVTAQADGTWEAWVPLIEGSNLVQATAYDALGNASTATPYSQVILRRDTQPPVVTPSGFLYTRQGTTFVLSATVSDAGLVNQTLVDTNHPQIGGNLPLGAWNADEATIGQTRAWQRSVGPVSSDGVFSATYRAADAADTSA